MAIFELQIPSTFYVSSWTKKTNGSPCEVKILIVLISLQIYEHYIYEHALLITYYNGITIYIVNTM